MLHLTKELRDAFLTIHQAIHDKELSGTNIDGKVYPILQSANGCRHLVYDNMNFMEQNPNKQSSYAQLARQGEQITWVIKPGSWLRIDKEGIHE